MINEAYSDDFVDQLSKCIGETVTIFTVSGGQSGCGFTGICILANSSYVRLITSVGPAPGCSLGNSCSGKGNASGYGYGYGYGGNIGSAGSVVDIPIERIASFVHNAV